MSSGPKNVTSTTNTEPPEFLRGPLTTAANAAESDFLRQTGGVSSGGGFGGGGGGFPRGRGGRGRGGGGFRSPDTFGGGGIPGPVTPGPDGRPPPGGAGGLIEQGQGLISDTIAGNFLNPDSNPFLQQTFDRAADLTRTRLSSEFAGSGRNLGAAFPARSDELQTLSSNIFGGNFQRERDRQQGALTGAFDFDPTNLFIDRLGGIIPGAGGTSTSNQPVFRTGLF